MVCMYGKVDFWIDNKKATIKVATAKKQAIHRIAPTKILNIYGC